MNNKSIITTLCSFFTLLIASCTEIEVTLPKGPEGAKGSNGLSAYEVWKENVDNGSIVWKKGKTEIKDFFQFLQGKEGLSSYELWKKLAETGDLDNPKEEGKKWNKAETTISDYWRFLAGKEGTTPHIGGNGNWYIGKHDTQISAKGKKGETPHIGENGNWYIGDKDTHKKATGRDGQSAYDLWKAEVEKGNIKDPNKEGEDNATWPKEKNSLQDFFTFISGGKKGQNSLEEKIKELSTPTPLTVESQEAKKEENTVSEESNETEKREEKQIWVIKVKTDPKASVTLKGNGKKETKTANETGEVTFEVERNPAQDTSYLLMAKADGKATSDPEMVTVPKAVMKKSFDLVVSETQAYNNKPIGDASDQVQKTNDPEKPYTFKLYKYSDDYGFIRIPCKGDNIKRINFNWEPKPSSSVTGQIKKVNGKFYLFLGGAQVINKINEVCTFKLIVTYNDYTSDEFTYGFINLGTEKPKTATGDQAGGTSGNQGGGSSTTIGTGGITTS